MSGLQAEAAITAPVEGLEPPIGPARPAIRPLLVSASATVMLQGGSLVIGFGTSVLLARFLGGEGYGQYVFALAWVGLLMIPAILGLDRFLVRGIARYEVRQEWGLMRGLLRRANQFALSISVAITIVGWIIAALWLASPLRWPFCIAMLLIPITSLTILRQAAMQAIGRVVSGQFPEYLIRPVLILAVICALRLAGDHALTSTTALAANVTGVAVAFIVGALLLRRALPRVLRSVRPRYCTRQWLRASLPMMLISGIWMANNYVTTLIVGTGGGPPAARVVSVVE
jgi:O-antigen/teichoic acid export membrane protein